ncbi:histone-lysine N-methyltransferase SETMAR [Trichonephila clavipes]|nr:histone-lysine N-methyltransferase SETMAR [Trichonephila clavipes]
MANRRCVVFHQDNARPRTSVVTRQKLWELGLEVLMHPPYSPDLTPSDCHLFLLLQNFLSDKKLRSREDWFRETQFEDDLLYTKEGGFGGGRKSLLASLKVERRDSVSLL